MKRVNKKNDKWYSTALSKSIDPGIALGFVENVTDLHTLCEGLVAVDGETIALSEIALAFWASSNTPFMLLPVLVQTAGTLSDTTNVSCTTFRDALDDACNDVFGWKALLPHPIISGRLYTVTDGTAHYGIQPKYLTLSGDILAAITKELETERFQDLYIAFLGKANTQANVTLEVRYTLRFRNIAKRVEVNR